VVDPLTAVRDHPSWFFHSGSFDPDEVVTLLIREAKLAGANSVAVTEDRDWVAVSADVDWLEGDITSFKVLTSYPEGGPNSARIETAIAAFCPGVATRAGTELVDVVRSQETGVQIEQVMLTIPIAGRIVAFLPPSRREPSRQEIIDYRYTPDRFEDVIDKFLEKKFLEKV
jgi:hypothetical protein